MEQAVPCPLHGQLLQVVCPCRRALGDPPLGPHLLLSGGLLARNSGVGPLLFSAKSMAIWISSTHFSISDLELKRRGAGFQSPAGKGADREGSGVRLTWPPRRRTAAGPGGSGSGAHPTRPRFPRSVGRVCVVLLPRGKWDTRCIFKHSLNWLWLKGTTKARNCFLAVPINFPLPGGGQAAPARGVGSTALGAGEDALSGAPGPGLPHGHDSSLPHVILEGGCPDISHAGGAASRAPLREPERGQGA